MLADPRQTSLFAPLQAVRPAAPKPAVRSDNVVALDVPIYVPQKNLVLLPETDKYVQIAPPGTPTVTLPLNNGTTQQMLVARNTPGLNQLLYNLGHEVPSPILQDYDWRGQTPFITQRLTAAMMVSRTRAFILNALGTGKTLSALFAIDWLIDRGYAKRALVVAPLSTLETVWAQEIRYRMPKLRAVVLHGERRQRMDLVRSNDWNVAIINPDGVRVIADTLLRKGFDIVVIDELATYRERRTERWKKINPLVQRAGWAWGMTGSPTPNGPSDIYGQIKLLRPEIIGNSFLKFRDSLEYEYAKGKWKARPNAEAAVHSFMQPATRFTLDQVVEIPETLYLTRVTTNSPEQERLVKKLKAELLVEYAEGRVTAINAAALFNKLLQAYLGFVYTDTQDVIDLNPVDRVATISELVSEAEGKVLVFVPFKHACRMLPAKLGWTTGPGGICATVYGDTPVKDRTAAFRDFQDPHAPLRYILAHPGTMSHGLTLTQAATIIWAAPITSYETYMQANGRISRVGQQRVQRVIHVTGSSLENRVYRTLEQRGNVQSAILKLFEEGLQ